MRLIRRREFVALLASPAIAISAVRGDKAMYLGGTAGIPEKTEGELRVTDPVNLQFNYRGGTLTVPYQQVTSLEYGQKVGRRVGVAIAINVFALFSKKRKHFLTIGYQDSQGKKNGVVFELAKDTVRSTLTTLEARTGKEIEYESEEAKKNIGD
jgi:hypothetical protein